MTAISPFAPQSVPQLNAIEGIAIATGRAGIKYAGRDDVMAIVCAPGTTIVGTFTKSKCPSAPVDVCRAHLPAGKARVVIVNSGNANAFTGSKGVEATDRTIAIAQKALGCAREEIYLSSTGVIGEPLDASKFDAVLPDMINGANENNWTAGAAAIMTTDTFPKTSTRTVIMDGVRVTVNGMAKGAGMIAPDMATMLAYIATDAAISAEALQRIVAKHVSTTFNAISVDSDTSTSDTLLVMASGKAAMRPLTTANSPGFTKLARAIGEVMADLAAQIIRDGEGVRKVFEVRVTGAISKSSARKIAKSITDSPLVKTAIAGEDANWGRIVMAVGKAGEPADRDKLTISFGDLTVAENGQRAAEYLEAEASAYMKNSEIIITVDLALGSGKFTTWGCDLTKEYVAINGDYRS